MLAPLLILGLLLQAGASPPGVNPSAVHTAPSALMDTDAEPTALLKVKRIYVDSFGEDVISRELQSMIVSSLVATKRFKVTETARKRTQP